MRVQLCQTPAKQPKRALTSGSRSDIQHGCAVTGFICDTLAHDHPPCSARCFQRAVRFSKGLARSYKTTSGFEPFSAFFVILVLHLLCLQTIHNAYRRHFPAIFSLISSEYYGKTEAESHCRIHNCGCFRCSC